ncbi:MAG: methyltransferase domain-containing protein [Thermodesulfobacteriota bacterium]
MLSLGIMETFEPLLAGANPGLADAAANEMAFYFSVFAIRLMNPVQSLYRIALKLLLPEQVYEYVLALKDGNDFVPKVGSVGFGHLRRLKPISTCYGYDRGLPVDRYYIENFLSENSGFVRGRVLEIGDNEYTLRFGGKNVVKSDILNLDKRANPETTIEADLTSAPHIPDNSFDCIIFTQTLMLIYDMHSVIRTLNRILKPGGTLLATLGGISNTSGIHPWEKNWCWHFTTVSAEKLFEEEFPNAEIEVQGYGNVLSAISLLQGLSYSELTMKELDYYDPNYEVVVSVRAVKKPVS